MFGARLFVVFIKEPLVRAVLIFLVAGMYKKIYSMGSAFLVLPPVPKRHSTHLTPPPPLSITPFSSYTHVLHQNQGLSLTPPLVDDAFRRFLTPPPIDDTFALSTTRGGGGIKTRLLGGIQNFCHFGSDFWVSFSVIFLFAISVIPLLSLARTPPPGGTSDWFFESD